MPASAIGIDFGTTNSSIAHASSSGDVELAHFPQTGGLTDAYRSLLYLEQERERGAKVTKSWNGTEVFGRRVTLEDLIARILRDLREKAELQFGIRIRFAVVGRPVHFVGAKREADDRYAEARLK